MSDSGGEPITVSTDGVTIQKSIDFDRFQTPAVVVKLRSEGDDPVQVRVSETVPSFVSMDDVGFHPDYGGEHWTIEDRSVVFERLFEPGEEYTTIYGVRGVDGDDLEEFLGDPSVEVSVEESGEAPGVGDLVSEDDSQAVRDLVSGSRDTLADDEAGTPGESGQPDEPEPTAADAPSADESPLAEEPLAEDSSTSSTASGEANDGTESPLDDESLLDDESPLGDESPLDEESLLADDAPGDYLSSADDETSAADDRDAEDASVDDDAGDESEPEPATGSTDGPGSAVGAVASADDMPTGGIARVLAKELREGNVSAADRELLRDELLPGDGSTDARVDHLQRQVADLAAYTDALEAFLDEEGGAQRVIDDLRGDLRNLRAEVDDVLDEADGLGDEVADIHADLDEVADDVEALSEGLAAVEDDVERVEERVEGNADVIDDLEGDVADLEDATAGLDDDREAIDELDERADEFEAAIDELREDLQDMAAFRERLSSVFGGGGVAGGMGAMGEDASGKTVGEDDPGESSDDPDENEGSSDEPAGGDGSSGDDEGPVGDDENSAEDEEE